MGVTYGLPSATPADIWSYGVRNLTMIPVYASAALGAGANLVPAAGRVIIHGGNTSTATFEIWSTVTAAWQPLRNDINTAAVGTGQNVWASLNAIRCDGVSIRLLQAGAGTVEYYYVIGV